MSALRAWLIASVLQGLAVGGLFGLAGAAYDKPRLIGQGVEELLLHLLLLLLGPAAGVVAVVGIYRLHRDHPLLRAVATTLLFVPTLLLAALAVCISILFSGIV